MSLLPVVPNTTAGAYRLDLASDDGVTFDLNAGAPATVRTFTWAPAGAAFYGVEQDFSTGAALYRYAAGPVYRMDLAGFQGTQTMLDSGGAPESLTRLDQVQFNPSGTLAFVSYFTTTHMVATYSLSSPFNGTLTRVREDMISSTRINSFFFNGDGTKVFYGVDSGSGSPILQSRALSSEFSLASMGVAETVFEMTDVAAYSFAGARAGTRLIVSQRDLDDDSDSVREYACAPYDFASASLLTTLPVASQVRFANYSPIGRKFFTQALTSGVVTQYSTVA